MEGVEPETTESTPIKAEDSFAPLEYLFVSNTYGKAMPTLEATVKQQTRRKQMEIFIDMQPDHIKERLNTQYGKLHDRRSFYSPPQARHMLILVRKYGYLEELDTLDGNHPQTSWENLATAVPDARDFLDLMQEYGNVDFTTLHGYPPGWESETTLNMDRVRMASAAILHFEGDMARVIRYVAGPHVGAHRNIPAIIQFLRGKIPKEELDEFEMVMSRGLPQHCHATNTEENYQDYYRYGNHPSCDSDPAKTRATLIKDNKKGYTLVFDHRLLKFLLHSHITPQGITDLDHPYKKPRPFFDGSFRPKVTSMSLNDWLSSSTEPDLSFMGAEDSLMRRVNAARVENLFRENYLGDDDASGAHRHVKYMLELIAMHSSQQCGYGVVNTGAAFGDRTACANFEPIARARRSLAQWLYIHCHDIVERCAKYLPELELAPPPTPEEIAEFTPPADLDSQNPSILFPDGSRKPPPYLMYCDDCPYLDDEDNIRRAVSCSAMALFILLGFPNDLVPNALSKDKLVTLYTHQRDWLGRAWDTRALTVGVIEYKRQQLADLLSHYTTSTKVTIKDLAVLLGTLEHHTRYAPRFRPWLFNVQNELRDEVKRRYSIALRIRKRKNYEHQLMQELPNSMWDRLQHIMGKETAKFIWSTHQSLEITPSMASALRFLHEYVVSDPHPFREYIPMIISRDPHVVSWGDASTGDGGGAFCPTLQFWFDMGWESWDPSLPQLIADGKVHINSLEFVVIILQLAAVRTRLDNMPIAMEKAIFPNGIPYWPVWKGMSDNTATVKWTNKLSSKSIPAQRLMAIYGEMLSHCRINTNCEHIPGDKNVIADFISRQPFSQPLSYRAKQLFVRYPTTMTYDYFQPSPELKQSLIFALCTDSGPTRPKLPKHLGHFERVSVTF